MIWGFIMGYIAGAIGMILLGRHYAKKKAEENNHEV